MPTASQKSTRCGAANPAPHELMPRVLAFGAAGGLDFGEQRADRFVLLLQQCDHVSHAVRIPEMWAITPYLNSFGTEELAHRVVER